VKLLNTQMPSGDMESISTLRGITPFDPDVVVRVLGHRGPRRGGGGAFAWDSGSTAADDGGTVIAPEGSGAGRWIREFSGEVDATWFGATIGTLSTAEALSGNTESIQRAIIAAQTAGASLFFPQGIYEVNAPLVPSSALPPLKIRGAGRDLTFISLKQSGAVHSLFELPDALCQNFEFQDISLDAGGLAQFCIYAPKVAHSAFSRCGMTGATGCLLALSYGWCNEIRGCAFRDSAGDAIRFFDSLVNDASGNNDLRIRDCKIYANAGWGVMIDRSRGVTIDGCTLEANRKGAVYINFASHAVRVVGNYFEANADLGMAFAEPSVTVKADVIINGADGSVGKIMGVAPCQGVIIDANYTTAQHIDSFVYSAKVAGLDVTGNNGYDASKPLILFDERAPSEWINDVHMIGNSGFLPTV
jgi:hypothetical protein